MHFFKKMHTDITVNIKLCCETIISHERRTFNTLAIKKCGLGGRREPPKLDKLVSGNPSRTFGAVIHSLVAASLPKGEGYGWQVFSLQLSAFRNGGLIFV